MKTLFFALIMFTELFMFGQNYCFVPNYAGTTSPDTDPFDITYGYTRTAIIYNKADIGASGTINQMVIPVISGYNDSIDITIKLKEVSFSYWGGTGTYSSLSSGATTVFSGKVKFNTGYCYIDLTTPFAFSNTNHLIIFTETDFGGNGSITRPTFPCYTITNMSGYEYYSLRWHNDYSVPTNNGFDGDKYPVWALVFNSPNGPQSVNATSQCDGIMLNWQKNTTGDDVVIVRKAGSAPINKPSMGTNYSIGDDLGNNTYIAYVGSAASYLDTAANAGTEYFYSAYSDDGNQIFSELYKTDSAFMPAITPYSIDFDSALSYPEGWEGDMSITFAHGNSGNALIALLDDPTEEFYAVSAPVCISGASAIVEFDYRIINTTSYPLNATPSNEIGPVYIQVSNNGGNSFTTIDSISPTNHTASVNFETFQSSLAAYNNEMVLIKILCTGGSGSYYLDIDDFKVYDYVGIEENAANNLHIFPNPVDDYLNIENNDANISMVCIYDMNGKLLIEHKTDNSANIRINIKQLASGMYMVKSMSENELFQNLIIKN
ncbi:MAG: T9SS type A sorting domain-containing protein [Bacteroidales bacterium]|nr:T9SS type A sorting domain-containing protein [Bacteroidales bacterium]